MAQDPRKFLLDSDYTTPVFVGKWQGSFTIPAYEYLDTGFNHNLPFTPLIVGQWSLNSNFQPSYDIATSNGYSIGVSFNQAAGSDSTKILFKLDNGYSSSKTYYYRLFAFCPSDYNGDVSPVDDSTPYKFSSDFNYHKLLTYGTRNVTSNNDIVINHNLGYVPQVRTWLKDPFNNFIAPFVNLQYQDGSFTSGTIVTPSTLTIKGVTSGDVVYYHIYADEV